MQRRSFLKFLGCTAGAMAATELLPNVFGVARQALAADPGKTLSRVEARHYRKLPEGSIQCGICSRHCEVSPGERGYCGVRENQGGTYRTLVYGLPCALNIDPIEKKPFFHFYPGTQALSLATAGCNVNCMFCQNWEISQARPEDTDNYEYEPKALVDTCTAKQVPTIAYTYNEPTVFFEYMYDIAALGQKQQVRSVLVSNGFWAKESLADLLPHLNAVKIDLKSIRKDYYTNVVHGELAPVLDRILQVKQSGVWLELVNLVVPTMNDTESDFRDLARWVKTNLGPDVPVHYSQFYPKYKLTNLPPTPQKTLEMAYDISRAEGLSFVYLGNLPGHSSESTYCPKCNEMLIERRGFRVYKNLVTKNACPKCGRQIPGLF